MKALRGALLLLPVCARACRPHCAEPPAPPLREASLHQTTRPVRTIARLALVGGLVIVSTLLNPFSPGAQAAAPTSTVLPLERGHDVVAARDRVFVSGGPASTSVVVTDAAGTVTGVLDELPGPSDLLLSG